MQPNYRAMIRPSLYLGVFVCLVFLYPGFAYGGSQTSTYINKNDPRVSGLVEVFSEYGFAMINDYTDLGVREEIARKVIEISVNNGFDAGLVVAVCRYEDEFIKSSTRLLWFHTDTGFIYADSQLPRVWVDLDRVIRALKWVYGNYKDKPKDALAYYLVGQRYFPPDGYDGLNDEMKGTINKILADGETYQKRINASKGPVIIDVPSGQGAGKGQAGPDSSVLSNKEIREAYISAILFYNSRLDEETANEIFDAIALNATEFPEIDARLVMALVACESSFNPNAVSRCGAMGLGQLMPFTAVKHGVDDPFDIAENIRATYEYLQNEFERWDGYDNVYDYVLASYNAGAGAVEKYGGIPPYDETINYVFKVTQVYKNFLKPEEYERYIFGKSKYY